MGGADRARAWSLPSRCTCRPGQAPKQPCTLAGPPALDCRGGGPGGDGASLSKEAGVDGPEVMD